jgi:hypothetical protein
MGKALAFAIPVLLLVTLFGPYVLRAVRGRPEPRQISPDASNAARVGNWLWNGYRGLLPRQQVFLLLIAFIFVMWLVAMIARLVVPTP